MDFSSKLLLLWILRTALIQSEYMTNFSNNHHQIITFQYLSTKRQCNGRRGPLR